LLLICALSPSERRAKVAGGSALAPRAGVLLPLSLALVLTTVGTPPMLSIRVSARGQVKAAEDSYAAGHYRQALRLLRVVYALEPQPGYLISFAQVYRALGWRREAFKRCELYLGSGEMPLSSSVRRLARELRFEIDRANARRCRHAQDESEATRDGK